MSIITSMVLVTAPGEHEAVGEINQWCKKNDPERGQIFKPLNTDDAGGTKYLTVDVYAMAGNFFPFKELIEHLPSFSWTWAEEVALIVSHENNDHVEIVTLSAPPADEKK